MSSKTPESDPTAIGNLAQIFGTVTPAQLDKALEHQRRHPNVRLGEALVVCGAMNNRQRDEMMKAQRRVRTRPQTKDISAIVDFAAGKALNTGEKLASLGTDLRKDVDALLAEITGTFKKPPL